VRGRKALVAVAMLATLCAAQNESAMAATTEDPGSTTTTPPATTPPATTPPVTTPPVTKPPTKPSKPKPLKLTKTVLKTVEKKLDDLGFPTGTVDGTISTRTDQALCAWRDINDLKITRKGLDVGLATSILAATKKPKADRPDGIYVDKTCQVLIQVVKGKYKRIVWVSTAASGFNTPNGTGHVWKKIAGWHESSLYKDAFMYDAMYFRTDRPAIALHGSVTNDLVHTYPDSHGCVRVWRPTIASIFAETKIGTLVKVYGKY
jgi:lipoprotein-anchoring transpeptidase ErfK/SrfK